MKIDWNNRYATIAIYAFFVICASILLYLGMSQISEIKASISSMIGTLQPFIIGGTLAYILNFILKFYEEKVLSHEYFKNVKVSDELKVIACSDFDFSCYNNIPDSLLRFIKNKSNNKESDYEKEIENKKEIELLKAKLALELA